MLDSAKALARLAACLPIIFAGCASDRPPASDWQSDTGVSVPAPVTKEPETAPPIILPFLSQAPAVTPPPAPAPAVPTARPVVTNQPAVTWVPLNRWCAANGFDKLSPMTLDSFPAFALSTTNGVFVLRTGSPVAQWNGLEIRLAYAPQLIGDQPFIHTLDLNKTLQPLVAGSPAILLSSNPVIVIDPGHGGEDSGTRSVLGNGYEKDFTLDWARRLASLLSANGVQVYLTRTNNSQISLSNRVAFAEQCKAGLFISLHFNSSGGNDRQQGLETYCLTPRGMYSSVMREFVDDPALSFPNNAFDSQNLQLAFRVHRAILLASGDRDRGVRRARYLSVLRGQNRPAILIEGGYLSNPQEARRIADPAYRQRLAEAVAKAISELPELPCPSPMVPSTVTDPAGPRSEASNQPPSTP